MSFRTDTISGRINSGTPSMITLIQIHDLKRILELERAVKTENRPFQIRMFAHNLAGIGTLSACYGYQYIHRLMNTRQLRGVYLAEQPDQ